MPFPELDWQGIVHRFYREEQKVGNHGRIAKAYRQPRKYTYQQRWTDTEEYQQSLSIPSNSGVLHGGRFSRQSCSDEC